MKLLTITAMLLLLAFPGAKIGFSQTTETPVTGSEAAGSTSKAEPKLEDDVAASTPELALRKFLLAMAVGDIKKLKAVTHPHDGLEVLLPKEKLPAGAAEKMKAKFEKMAITRLKADDKFKLPGGKSISFGKRKVNEDNAVLSFPGNMFPIIAVRKGGEWKINPEPIVAMRQAAKHLLEMKKHAAKMKPGKDAPMKDVPAK